MEAGVGTGVSAARAARARLAPACVDTGAGTTTGFCAVAICAARARVAPVCVEMDETGAGGEVFSAADSGFGCPAASCSVPALSALARSLLEWAAAASARRSARRCASFSMARSVSLIER